MIQANQSSTCPLIPGKKYFLYIHNITGVAVTPDHGLEPLGGIEPILAENSETAFSVSAFSSRWITFYAVRPNLYINSTSASVLWHCDNIG